MTRQIDGGYILLSRRLIKSEIWEKPPIYIKIWIYLLSKASHRDHKNLKRGQCFVTIKELQDQCEYYQGYRLIRPSYKQIWDVIEWLRGPSHTNYEGNNEGKDIGNTYEPMVETMKVKDGFLVTIVNYSLYQDPTTYESKAESKAESKDTGKTYETHTNYAGKIIYNKNDYKNDYKNDIKISSSFDEIVSSWNSLGGNIPQIQALNSGTKRYKMLVARINQYGEDKVLEAMSQISNSSFLQGRVNEFVITFDWFVRPNNFLKVLEGNYSDHKPRPKKETRKSQRPQILTREPIPDRDIDILVDRKFEALKRKTRKRANEKDDG